MAKISRVLCEQYGIDPSPAEDLDEAYRRQDLDDWYAALVRFGKALAEARGTHRS
jgi:hypothetical protein